MCPSAAVLQAVNLAEVLTGIMLKSDTTLGASDQLIANIKQVGKAGSDDEWEGGTAEQLCSIGADAVAATGAAAAAAAEDILMRINADPCHGLCRVHVPCHQERLRRQSIHESTEDRKTFCTHLPPCQSQPQPTEKCQRGL